MFKQKQTKALGRSVPEGKLSQCSAKQHLSVLLLIISGHIDIPVADGPLLGNTEPTQRGFPRLAARRLLLILGAPATLSRRAACEQSF